MSKKNCATTKRTSGLKFENILNFEIFQQKNADIPLLSLRVYLHFFAGQFQNSKYFQIQGPMFIFLLDNFCWTILPSPQKSVTD